MRFTFATSIVALVVLTTAAPQLPLGQKTGVAIPLDKRSGFVNADKSVDIEALKSHVEWVKAKTLRGFENVEKNFTGASRSAALKGTQLRRANASVPAVKNGTWYGTIFVGTPPKEFTVNFDTGSSDLFLPAPSCKEHCAGHTIYSPRDSSTGRCFNKWFYLGYEDGSGVKGKVCNDTVTLGGLKAVNQTLGAATQYSAGFDISEFPADGIMGMAYQSLSNYPAMPVFQSLVAQNQGLASVFSFKLAAVESELYLGGANPDLYTGSFSYAPVTAQCYWQVKMDRVQGNGRTILDNVSSRIDTGSNLVVGVPSQVRRFHDMLNGTLAEERGDFYLYSFQCNSFPNVSFTFGGTPFPISTGTLNFGPVPGNETYCYSGIVAKNMGHPDWIIGGPFLQNVYTTFDFNHNHVGFAHLA